MRLVVDTNVFVSAALKQSSFPAAVVRWIGEHGHLLKSSETEAELLAVLRRPRIAQKLAPDFLAGINDLLARAELVPIERTVVACRDPDDDKFLELAINGGADVLVSGTTTCLPWTCSRAFRS